MTQVKPQELLTIDCMYVRIRESDAYRKRCGSRAYPTDKKLGTLSSGCIIIGGKNAHGHI